MPDRSSTVRRTKLLLSRLITDVCLTSESPEPPSEATSGALQSRNNPFESLKRILSSPSERKALYVLQTGEATLAIDILEQVGEKEAVS